jgi:hypothetical protein
MDNWNKIDKRPFEVKKKKICRYFHGVRNKRG